MADVRWWKKFRATFCPKAWGAVGAVARVGLAEYVFPPQGGPGGPSVWESLYPFLLFPHGVRFRFGLPWGTLFSPPNFAPRRGGNDGSRAKGPKGKEKLTRSRGKV